MHKIFFDSNVFIDAFASRDNSKSSVQLISKVITGEVKGYLASKQITDIYYVLKKYGLGDNRRRDILKIIVINFTVLPTLGSEISYCLSKPNLIDFEDDLLDEICKINCIQYLVTSNLKDFNKSRNFVIEPKNLMTILNSNH